MLGLTQFVMRKAKVVRATEQIHAGFQCLQAVSRMTTFARESRQPLMRLMTVAIHSWGHTCKHARPRPAVRLTFSRNARLMLPGYAAHPSLHTKMACNGRQQARTCCNNRSANRRSRCTLTTPPSHRRVETIRANPIQAIIRHPFTRISSTCTCWASNCPCGTRA